MLSCPGIAEEKKVELVTIPAWEDEFEVYPSYCTRARRNCLQCLIEGKIQCFYLDRQV